jgi:hypothetical protein
MPRLLDPVAFRAGVWGNAPLNEWLYDPNLVVGIEEDWQDYNPTTGAYTLTAGDDGHRRRSTRARRARLLLDAGATTANQGANLQRLKSLFLPAAGKSIWAEFIVTLTAAAPPVTKAQLFVGLAASDTTIIAAGAQTTNNRIGWQILAAGNLTTGFTVDKAGVASLTAGPTLVDATKIRLGFRYDGAADTLQQYVNGVATGAVIATANIPKAAIYPSFVCQSDGVDRPNLFLHAYRVIQLR